MQSRPLSDAATDHLGRHPLACLLIAPSRRVRALLAITVAALMVYGLLRLTTPLEWLEPRGIYHKDFLAVYVLARATAAGDDPYRPIQELAERYVGPLPYRIVAHPTPHPPTLGVLLLPLAGLEYVAAAHVWFALELACLVAAVWLLARAGRGHPPRWAILPVAIMALGWYPVWHDLQYGQLNFIILLLLAGMWLALERERPLMAGILLGASLLVKQIAWPLVLLLALRRVWPGVAAAVGVVLLGYLAADGLVGSSAIINYRHALPEVIQIYQGFPGNQSLWTVGLRLFSGTTVIVTPPLIPSERAAAAVSAAVPALALLAALLVARRQPSHASAIGIVVCASTVINPLAWPHYLILAFIPLAWIIQWLVVHGWPERETNLALLATALLLPGYPTWEAWAFRVAGQTPPAQGGSPVLPFAPAWLMLGPTVAVLALASLVAVLGRRSPATAAGVDGAAARGPGREEGI